MINVMELHEKRIYGPGRARLKGIIKIYRIAGPGGGPGAGWDSRDTDTPFGILWEY